MAGDDPLLLLIAADQRAEILDTLGRYRDLPPAQLTATVRTAGLSHGRERLAIVAPAAALHASIDFAIARLPAVTRPRWVARAQGISFTRDQSPGRVGFLFPGQGSQHVGMLRELRTRLAIVGGWFDALDEAAVAAGLPPISALLDERGSDADRAARRVALHDMERGAQLGTVADLALHEVLRALGIEGDVYIGHSNGEHPAVMAAGRVSAGRAALCDGFVRLGAAGTRLPKPQEPEGLVAVSAMSRDRLGQVLQARPVPLWFAMDNCPNQLVVGGSAAALTTLVSDVVAAGGVAVALPFARAFHTPLFSDWAATLSRYYRELHLDKGRVPVYSCYTAAPLPGDAEQCREVMAAQWTGLIRFRDTIERVYAEGVRTFIEVGPGSTLTAFVEDVLRSRPHLAVSTSPGSRGEVAQLCHLLGELFLAGLPIDPDRLPSLLEGAVPSREPDVDAAAVHRRLIAETRRRLARAATKMVAGHPALPLLGAVVRDTAGGLIAHRPFSRATDRFVDDHALGRPRAAHPDGGYPLPVLPFTLSLEIAAEAARALTGRRVCEIRDARAVRWLALDGGALSLEIAATTAADGVRVRLGETGDQAPGPAFEAVVLTDAITDAPPSVPHDPEAQAPERWTAATFYERYAFHGPGFQGLSTVRSVGPRGIDADVVITTIDGLRPETLDLDPAMLDCAGQLVAFWLLEHGQRAPSFGIFPFSARRVVVAGPPPPAGTRIRCRCAVTLRGSITDATCVFENEEGRLVAAIEGFLQRLIPFPDALARAIFGGEPVTGTSAIRDIDPEIFSASWGIWERALAHLTLAPSDLAHWRAVPAQDGERLRWLLGRVGRS
jgi:acyl transferase domain-containing protein